MRQRLEGRIRILDSSFILCLKCLVNIFFTGFKYFLQLLKCRVLPNSYGLFGFVGDGLFNRLSPALGDFDHRSPNLWYHLGAL